MSLFKAREWWSRHLSGGNYGNNEVFDQGCLCLGNLDSNTEGLSQIVAGSQSGLLRIFSPKPTDNEAESRDANDSEDLWIEFQTGAPILQLAVGKFTDHTNYLNLAVLHPRKLVVYSLSGQTGSVAHGCQWQLKSAYEHNLARTAYNMCHGPFGQVEKDFICVQSIDASLSVFEQESFAFTRFLPDSLIPGPLRYVTQIDSFITVSGARNLEAYRYQVLAVAADSKSRDEAASMKGGKRVTADWSINLGEPVVSIDVAPVMNSQSIILVLGRRHFYAVTELGKMKFTRRLDFTPVALCVYGDAGIESTGVRHLLVTAGGQILVYRDNHLLWAARMQNSVVDLAVGNFQGLRGSVVTLDESGMLQCLYMGTDPSLGVMPPAYDIRENNYDDQDAEMCQLQRRIKEASGAGPSLVTTTRHENELKIQIQLPVGLDEVSMAENSEVLGGDLVPSYTFKFILKPKAPMNSVQVHVEARHPFTVNQKQFNFISVDANQSNESSVTFYVSKPIIPSDLSATLIATYSTIQNTPRVTQATVSLPLSLTMMACMPVKQASYKLTLDTNQPPANLNNIFSDMLCEGGDPNGCALGFRYIGQGPVITLLASKTSQRYRLQSDSFAALWPLTKELISRLSSHYGSNFQASFNDPLPLSDFFVSLDAHWEARAALRDMEALVAQRAGQFRAIQRRLLTRFKDKTPQPLANLDTLLEGSLRQLTQLADMTEDAKRQLEASSNELCGSSNLLALLIRLAKPMSSDEFSVLSNVLSGAVQDSLDCGMEEMLDCALTHMLRTVLSKATKDTQMSPAPLTMPADTTRLKKHVQMLCEKIGRGVQMTPSVPPSAATKAASRPAIQPISIVEPIQEDLEPSGDTSTGKLAPLTDIRSPRPLDKKKNKKKKSKRHKDQDDDGTDEIAFPEPSEETPSEGDSFYR